MEADYKKNIYKPFMSSVEECHAELIEESKDFLKLFGASQICFDFCTSDHKTWMINSDPELFSFYLESNGLLSDPMVKSPEITKNKNCLWESYKVKDYSPILQGFSKHFNINHGMSFSRLRPNGSSVGIAIGGSGDYLPFVKRIVNNLYLIDQFIGHLEGKFVAKLIKQQHQGVILPDFKSGYFEDDQPQHELLKQRIKVLHAMDKLNEADADLFCGVEFTTIQTRCAYLYLQGLPVNKISTNLQITVKYAREQLDAVKKKLKVSKQEKLLEMLENMRLLGLLDMAVMKIT